MDNTQREIVAALRKLGASVQSLADVGNGCPDLLVGLRHTTFLIEVKDSGQPPSKRRLTPCEEKWHAEWRGAPVIILDSADGAIEYILRLNERKT